MKCEFEADITKEGCQMDISLCFIQGFLYTLPDMLSYRLYPMGQELWDILQIKRCAEKWLYKNKFNLQKDNWIDINFKILWQTLSTNIEQNDNLFYVNDEFKQQLKQCSCCWQNYNF